MSGRALLAYVAICVGSVLAVDGYLIHKVFANEAARQKTVTIQETVPTNLRPRCPEPKVIIIKSGKLDVPIG